MVKLPPVAILPFLFGGPFFQKRLRSGMNLTVGTRSMSASRPDVKFENSTRITHTLGVLCFQHLLLGPIQMGCKCRKRTTRASNPWRFVFGALVLHLAVISAPGTSHAAIQCLSAKETREVVAQKLVISPAAALRAARASTGGGQAVLARLCRRETGFIYQFAILRPDGKVVRLTLDGVTGRVMRRREQAGQKKSARPVNEHLLDREAPAERVPEKANL